MKVKQIVSRPGDFIQKLESAILKDARLKIKRLDRSGFHFISKKNYGGMNMVEKPHYRIQGKFESQGQETHVNYKVRGNSTFSIIAIVLCLQIIPVVAIPLLSEHAAGWPYFLAAFVFVIAAVSFLLVQQEKGLKKGGEAVFEEVMGFLINYSQKSLRKE